MSMCKVLFMGYVAAPPEQKTLRDGVMTKVVLTQRVFRGTKGERDNEAEFVSFDGKMGESIMALAPGDKVHVEAMLMGKRSDKGWLNYTLRVDDLTFVCHSGEIPETNLGNTHGDDTPF